MTLSKKCLVDLIKSHVDQNEDSFQERAFEIAKAFEENEKYDQAEEIYSLFIPNGVIINKEDYTNEDPTK
jgi:hypothetical protein